MLSSLIMKYRPFAIFYIVTGILFIWLGFAIRLHNLGGDSFWGDEIATIRFSNKGLETALGATRDHPPLIYLFTATSIQLWGENEFAARLPAFFAGVLTIPLMLILGKIFRQPWVGFWAALFLVFSPFHLKYSQEVRHYTLLLLTSLASYFFLYRAMVKSRRFTWAAYALLTTLMLYTHYGGFVVLITQFVVALFWLSIQLYKRNFRIFSSIFPVFLIPLLYLPWLARFLAALLFNTNEELSTDTGSGAPLTSWVREAFNSFGMYEEWRPWLFLLLAGLGILFWLRSGPWKQIAFIAVSLILPFLLIQLFGIARGVFARYIIYILPFYLLLAAITPAAILQWVAKNRFSKSHLAGTLGLAVVFGVSSLEPLHNEYQFIQSDWKGIIQYFDENGNEDDIILGLTLSHPTGFNPIYDALPYYLAQTGRSYNLLQDYSYDEDRLIALSGEGKKVFAIVSNWDRPTEFEDPAFKVTPFSRHLFVVENTNQQGPILDRIIDYYEQTLPIASKPAAFCFLYRNLAALEAASGRYLLANEQMNTARNFCDNLPDQATFGVRGDTKEAIFKGLLNQMEQANQAGDIEIARTLANLLLTFNNKHPAALDTLTAVNLHQMYRQGQADIDLHQAPEPVSIQEFVMPHNGDIGEALLIHPPAAVAFEVNLPEEPVKFSSRIAQAPASWVWGGDGVTFVLRLETAGGQPVELFRQYLENTAANHNWHSVSLSLADYAGQHVTLILTTEEGPAGDGTGDWAGWETPRLLYLVD
jgi:hypothetical protein